MNSQSGKLEDGCSGDETEKSVTGRVVVHTNFQY